MRFIVSHDTTQDLMTLVDCRSFPLILIGFQSEIYTQDFHVLISFFLSLSPRQNSIRHNLSLHSRFVRVQNEGTGKSSWWMLNPEGGKSGKSPRRRATSMDNNSKFTKSRGRAAKKKVSWGEKNLCLLQILCVLKYECAGLNYCITKHDISVISYLFSYSDVCTVYNLKKKSLVFDLNSFKLFILSSLDVRVTLQCLKTELFTF